MKSPRRQRTINRTSPIKRRRATKAEVQHRRSELYDIVEAMQPMTVRQVFYQAAVRGLVEKTEDGYRKVQTDLVLMRRAGDLPYGWLADNTRWQRRRAPTHTSRFGWRRMRSPASFCR